MAPLGNCWERLCGYHCFCVWGMGWLQALIGLCRMASSISMKRHMLALHMGATKASWLQFEFLQQQIRTLLPNQVCTWVTLYKHNIVTLQQNGQKTRFASSDALLKRSNLCNFCMTQNCSNHTNMRWKICLHGLFMCLTYIHLLHTIPHMLCGPHPHVRGVIIWKIFHGKELMRVHAHY